MRLPYCFPPTLFTWKESGEVAYEQPAEAHLTIDAGQVVKIELR